MNRPNSFSSTLGLLKAFSDKTSHVLFFIKIESFSRLIIATGVLFMLLIELKLLLIKFELLKEVSCVHWLKSDKNKFSFSA